MSEPDTNPESDQNRRFRKMADRFIDNANRQLNDTEPSEVNSAFMYGASRFCAFITVQKTGTLERFDEMHDEAVEYYAGEFKKMLVENLKHYRAAIEKET